MTEPQFITTPFGAKSTAAEVLRGVDLSGSRAVVTGAASGIGVETARALAAAGAGVTLAVRSVEQGERTAEDIRATSGNRHVRAARLDLADLDSVAAFTAAWDGPLDILVNNAGVSAPPETRTPEGWELQFATNHLGHFALTTSLHPALAAAGGARVVSLSSNAHLRAPVDFEDIHFRGRPYERFTAYGQSKTATALFAVEANRLWAGERITVNAVHPGAIMTNLARHLTDEDLEHMADFEFKTPEQGAATSVLAAASPLLAGAGGRYFEDCSQARPHTVEAPLSGVADHALDPAAAAELWRASLGMLASAGRR
ncbi:SDR family NAD(P)-dependent oxidoreductase [Streptomyces sp. NPDC088354]|uniref:SDR family NAD(P)-dependent oxidoreductase n=1 Tax=unclassified Streptomyces TaxID=2593676 RepID=UPI0029BE3F07|nr:SDR family NAD(P)-dependent oxidoreductase [Streptomyces sp. MI02-7b]MDX3075753.1 SDR family NAD(P)-dependent oxidoreductase [Streptomyces sp. MI02-7b]